VDVEAIAGGTGTEVFNLSPTSQLVAAASGRCISVANGGLILQDCEDAVDAGDGRSTFMLTPSAHVQSKTGYCLSASANGASAVPCSTDRGSGVTMEAVPGFDPTATASLKDAAAMLRAAAARQTSFLGQLKNSLRACRGLVTNSSLSYEAAQSVALAQRAGSVVSNPIDAVSQRIDATVQVDLQAVKALISETKAILASA